MSNSIIRVVLFLLLCSTASASTLANLRARLSLYTADASDQMVAAADKDSVINRAMVEYAGMFPVYVDSAKILLDSAERIDTLPDNFGGIVLSVHKVNEKFDQVPYIKGDSIPALVAGAISFYTQREKSLVFYPPPIGPDSVVVFYSAIPAGMATAGTECPLMDYLEEPLVLLAASKIFLSSDMRPDLASQYYQAFLNEAQKLTRVKVESPQSQ